MSRDQGTLFGGHTHASYVDFITQGLPTGYSTKNLKRVSRHVLEHSPPDAWSGQGLERLGSLKPSKALEVPLCSEYLRLIMSFVQHGAPGSDEQPNARRGLVHALSHSKIESSDLRERGLNYAATHVASLLGLQTYLETSNEFQLQRERPWYRRGDFSQMERDRNRLESEGADLLEHGFLQIEREDYLLLAQPTCMIDLLHAPDNLLDVAQIIVLYTVARHERHDVEGLTRALHTDLRVRTRDALEELETSRIPRTLFGLPLEARVLGSFQMSLKANDTFKPDKLGSLRTKRMPSAGAFTKIAEDRTRVGFFDDKLVGYQEGEQARDRYIALEFDTEADSVLGALVNAIEQLEVNHLTLEHLPRVVAGMFTAAQLDQHRDWITPGTFWDTEEGHRLCKIIGFNPQNPGHRERVVAVRDLLTRIHFRREVKRTNESGRYEKVTWENTIIEPRSERCVVEVGSREGISSRSTLKSWSIATPLWSAVLPKSLGGTPYFMAIDQRAFGLDDSQSIAFNLYWSLVQRAYISRVGKEGVMSESLGTLLYWAGLKNKYERPARLRKNLREALEACIEEQLILSWSCPALDHTANMSALLDSEIVVTFSKEQARSFPERAQLPFET